MTTLVNFLGGTDSAGGKLKEAGTSHWDALNLGATNESGFTALPGRGRTTHTAGPIAIGVQALFWTSTEDTLNNGNARLWGLYGYYINAYGDNLPKGYGLNVRCVKD